MHKSLQGQPCFTIGFCNAVTFPSPPLPPWWMTSKFHTSRPDRLQKRLFLHVSVAVTNIMCRTASPPKRWSIHKQRPAWRTEFTFTKPVFEWKYLSKTKTQGSWGSTQPTPAIDVARLVLMYCFTTSRQFCLSPLPKVVNLFSRLQFITSLFFRTLPLWATVTGKV